MREPSPQQPWACIPAKAALAVTGGGSMLAVQVAVAMFWVWSLVVRSATVPVLAGRPAFV